MLYIFLFSPNTYWAGQKQDISSSVLNQNGTVPEELLGAECSCRRQGDTKKARLSSVQFSSVTQSCPTLCDPMNRSTPGLPVHHQLPELAQTHVYQVGDDPTISSSVVPFSSCLQSFPASGSFQISQLFT